MNQTIHERTNNQKQIEEEMKQKRKSAKQVMDSLRSKESLLKKKRKDKLHLELAVQSRRRRTGSLCWRETLCHSEISHL